MVENEVPFSKPFLVGCVYRPKDSPIEDLDKLTAQIERAHDIADDIVITGDFNVDLLQTANQRWAGKFGRILDLSQVITEPTRTTASTSTLIDHVWITRQTASEIKSTGVVSTGLSDHDAVFITKKKKFAKQTGGSFTTITFRSITAV